MPAPAAPTTAHTFAIVSRHDPALDHAACCDAWDSVRAPALVPDGVDPAAWVAFCEDGELPAGVEPSLWRGYLETGDPSALVTTGPLHVYTCRALSAQELEWAQVQSGGDTTAHHAAIVGIALVSVAGPRELSAAAIERERARSGFIRHIAWTSRLWHDPDLFTSFSLHSLAGQVSQRSRLPEAAATFRQAGGAV